MERPATVSAGFKPGADKTKPTKVGWGLETAVRSHSQSASADFGPLAPDLSPVHGRQSHQSESDGITYSRFEITGCTSLHHNCSSAS